MNWRVSSEGLVFGEGRRLFEVAVQKIASVRKTQVCRGSGGRTLLASLEDIILTFKERKVANFAALVPTQKP